MYTVLGYEGPAGRQSSLRVAVNAAKRLSAARGESIKVIDHNGKTVAIVKDRGRQTTFQAKEKRNPKMARRHRRRKNPLGEDLVIGLIGAGMGALITYFYVNAMATPPGASAALPPGSATPPS